MKQLCLITSPYSTLSGYGKKSYDIVKSIINLKKDIWDIKLIPLRWGDTPFNILKKDDDIHQYELKETIYQQPDIHIHIGLPNEFEQKGKKNILFTSGVETTIFPYNWVEGCNKSDVIIVPSQFTKNITENTKFDLERDGVKNSISVGKPVEVLFEGIDTSIFNPTKKLFDLKEVSEDFCFLFVGHFLNGEVGEDRKNVGLLIKLFLDTFKNKIHAPALILKTNSGSTSYVDQEQILFKIEQIKRSFNKKDRLPNIYLIHGDLEDEEMNMLYNHPKIKSLISFTKGEGFGRPLLEFGASTGKPMIVSNWSGHIDFIKPEFNILVNGVLTNVHPSAANDILIKEAGWFSIDTNEAKLKMKDMFENYKKYNKNILTQQNILSKKYNLDKMGKELEKILDTYIPKYVEFKLPRLT